jgi:hypothetical protein
MNLDDGVREAIAKVITFGRAANTQVGAVRGAMYRYARLLERQMAIEEHGGRLMLTEVDAAGKTVASETLDLRV